MSPIRRSRQMSRAPARRVNSYLDGEFKRSVKPPFSCICTLRYYDDQYLLNRPDFWLL
jgi:hypothetical protein